MDTGLKIPNVPQGMHSGQAAVELWTNVFPLGAIHPDGKRCSSETLNYETTWTDIERLRVKGKWEHTKHNSRECGNSLGNRCRTFNVQPVQVTAFRQ